jgi:hypothetical protein
MGGRTPGAAGRGAGLGATPTAPWMARPAASTDTSQVIELCRGYGGSGAGTSGSACGASSEPAIDVARDGLCCSRRPNPYRIEIALG